jgi:hypothetical protein
MEGQRERDLSDGRWMDGEIEARLGKLADGKLFL